jgi:hypothetical protein
MCSLACGLVVKIILACGLAVKRREMLSAMLPVAVAGWMRMISLRLTVGPQARH